MKMNRTLWTLQALLTLAFLGAGGMKLATPASEIATQFPWAENLPAWSPRVIGAPEVAGSVGLIAPQATGIAPLLTPAAAGGLGLTMVGAALLHLTRGEFAEMIPSLVLLGMCLFSSAQAAEGPSTPEGRLTHLPTVGPGHPLGGRSPTTRRPSTRAH